MDLCAMWEMTITQYTVLSLPVYHLVIKAFLDHPVYGPF